MRKHVGMGLTALLVLGSSLTSHAARPSPRGTTVRHPPPAPAPAPALPPPSSRSTGTAAPEHADSAYSNGGPSESRPVAFGGSFVYATPLAESFQTFKAGVGGLAEIWVPWTSEKGFTLHGEAGYQVFNVRNIDTSVSQMFFMAGLEFQSASSVLFIKPLISFDLGTYYSRLNLGGSDATLNAAFAFALQVRPGFSLPLGESLALEATMPFVSVLGQSRLFLWDTRVGFRITL
jgi:hypothetical protein